ncbi:MAG: putative oxidoreductase ORF5 in fasciation locus [bacterium]|nr:putative oxidoreductase ORF5 in fasciation locus [bacterium]
MSTQLATPSLLETLRARITGEVHTDGVIVQEVSSDFGRMIHRTPSIVIRPRTAADVQTAVRLAKEHGLTVSTRSAGHTQSGQALSDGGILLDMRSLNAIGAYNADHTAIQAQSGVVWKDLVNHTLKSQRIPRVLTNNLNVTVGGTLSVAGLGIASWKYGAQVDNVLELEVVTGQGDLVTCSPEENSELFDAVRSGFGQCGIIVGATIRLRQSKAYTRTFFLVYDDLSRFMQDTEVMFNEERCDYLESWCVPAAMGFKGSGASREAFAAWFFPMHVTVEFDDLSEAPNLTDISQGLGYYKDMGFQDLEIVEFSNRLERLFTIWRNMGYWDNPHPWMETILPWDVSAEFITTVLSQTPPQSMGGGHILLWPCTNKGGNAPLFRRPPDSPFVMGWGLLPGVPAKFLDIALPRLDMASAMSQAVGGQRYLSGYITFKTVEEWANHFGLQWDWFRSMKAKYDPDRILNPGFIVWE